MFSFASVAVPQSALAQYSQQAYVVGNDSVGPSGQGQFAAALSADGNTALVGGFDDNNGVGATWVFTRSGATWTQQGAKLVGTPSGSATNQGNAVALSADGNTALIGGAGDGNTTGAAWVFVRSGGTWTQQAKLVGTGYTGPCPYNSNVSSCPAQGAAVALSADGNTAMIGGPGDGFSTGAAWVFTRSGSTWTQQGAKLVGTGGAGMGSSVALSADGNTAAMGGPLGGNPQQTGGLWIFTRSSSTWTQQGSMLLPNDYTLYNTGIGPRIGTSVALSADGNTVVVGGPYDGGHGAAWAFTRSGGVWTQQGSKIVDTSSSTDGYQGFSIALSADGNIMMVGVDSAQVGAPASPFFVRNNGVWNQLGSTKQSGVGENVALSSDASTALSDHTIFVRSASGVASHDFNGDGKSDILWNNSTGDTAIWFMNGSQVSSAAGLGNASFWTVWGQRDFNGDGKSDVLWQDVSGDTAIWFMNGSQVTSAASLGNVPSSQWTIVGTGDFNGDGKGDILWRHTNGTVAIWLMNGATISSSVSLGVVPTNWAIYGTGDFNGDGKADILWRDNNGNTAIWFMNGGQISSSALVATVPCCWTIVGTGDFNGDGKADILWRNSVGDVAIWFMNGAQVASTAALGNVPINWSVAETGDFNGDGKSDILWRDSNSGTVAMWLMNGATVTSSSIIATVATTWAIQSAGAD